MNGRTLVSIGSAVLILLMAALACSLPFESNRPLTAPAQTTAELSAPTQSTQTPTVVHVTVPGEPRSGKVVYDVESQSTAPERRAPYGDSYDINRLERPFEQDMTYVADLDIYSYTVAGDSEWWYVVIDLMGTNPNNEAGINFGIELDQNHDGFGDLLILAQPPLLSAWDTAAVRILQDTNHDTSGKRADKCDAPITTDGYETVVFNGGPGDADPDLAWVRAVPGGVHFAFKKSWSGVVFMLGVFADAGLKDPTKLDYVDRFPEAEAGSPVRDKRYYPLGALFLVDNVCREAFGFDATGYEPQLCPREAPPPAPRERNTRESCVRDPACAGCGYEWDEANCTCIYHGPC